MSLFSALTASVSGMAAQANKLSTVSDNIANSGTTGYKQASTEFQNMVNQNSRSSYDAAGVGTFVRYSIGEQGILESSTSDTDLAIQGDGFFLVSDANDAIFLTRAGNFTPNADGDLVNISGYKLLGYGAASGATSADGLGVLTPVNIASDGLNAVPSTTGQLKVTLNSDAAAATGPLPSANLAGAEYTSKTSLVAYDNLGGAVNLDVYYTKTGTNAWEMSIFDAAGAAGGGFPYSDAALATQPLSFSAANGSLSGPTNISLAVPGGQALTVDIAGTMQIASSFAVENSITNGSAPSAAESVTVGADGTMTQVFVNGTQKTIFHIPLATVASVDNLTPLAGDVFRDNMLSGPILVGDADIGGFGSIQSKKLESSTVDLASQLTDMIVAQRSYESNSKVFQTGSELLSQLNNMLK